MLFVDHTKGRVIWHLIAYFDNYNINGSLHQHFSLKTVGSDFFLNIINIFLFGKMIPPK